MNKYELGEIVHYIIDGKPHSAPILSLMIVKNAHEDWASTDVQRDIFTPFGKSRVVYATCHGQIDESECYSSMNEMRRTCVNNINR